MGTVGSHGATVLNGMQYEGRMFGWPTSSKDTSPAPQNPPNLFFPHRTIPVAVSYTHLTLPTSDLV